MKEGIIPFDQGWNLKVMILELFGINMCVVWSSSCHIGKHLTSLEPEYNFINYNSLGS